jgi:hypothetical protein
MGDYFSDAHGWPSVVFSGDRLLIDPEDLEHDEVGEMFLFCPRCGIELNEKSLTPITVFPEKAEESVRDLKELQLIHYKNLHFLKKLEALKGPLHGDVELHNMIEIEKEEIAKIGKQLSNLQKGLREEG